MTDLGQFRRSRAKAGWGRATTARRKSEPAPRSDDDFVTRIQLALDMTPGQLAKALDMPFHEVRDRQGSRAKATSWAADPFWDVLLDYVNQRLGGLIVLKDELDRKHRLDMQAYREHQRAVRER